MKKGLLKTTKKLTSRISIFVVCILTVGSISVQSQSNIQPNVNSSDHANRILKAAQAAISQDKEATEIAGISSEYFVEQTSVFQKTEKNEPPKTNNSSGKLNLDLSYPNRLAYSSSMNHDDHFGYDGYKINGDTIVSNSYSIADGTRTDFTLNLTAEEVKTRLPDYKVKQLIRNISITLRIPFFENIEFSYIGKAEIDGVLTEGIEAQLPNQSVLRLYFDTTSHFLKLLTNTGTTPFGAEYDQKIMYSAYEKRDGLILATNLTSLLISKTKAGTFEITEKLILKEFKLNPRFKLDFFDRNP